MINTDFIPTIKYTPYLIFYEEKKIYVYMDGQTITHDLDKAQLFDTRTEAEKAMKKVLFRLCPKDLFKEYDIIEIQTNKDFPIITIKPPAQKKVKKKKPDDLSVKNYLIGQCLKFTIYEKSFLKKQTNEQLRWLLSNYQKRHFIPEDKPILAVKS